MAGAVCLVYISPILLTCCTRLQTYPNCAAGAAADKAMAAAEAAKEAAAEAARYASGSASVGTQKAKETAGAAYDAAGDAAGAAKHKGKKVTAVRAVSTAAGISGAYGCCLSASQQQLP